MVKRSRLQGAGAYCGGLSHSLFNMKLNCTERSMIRWMCGVNMDEKTKVKNSEN